MPDTATPSAGPGADSLSVFFPCYNEQDNVRRVYESAAQVLGSLGLDYEIILVDDGSTDQTAQIIDAIAKTDPRVKAVHHPTNRGYGAAVQSGIRAAAKSLVFFTDGDGQFDLNELPPLLPLMKQHDIVSCYRLNRQDGFVRSLNAWGWTTLVCLLFRMKIKDINCAFKLFRRRIFEDLEIQSTGALINAEILGRATRRRYSIIQVGVHHLPRTRGQQTGANPRVIFRAFRELFRLYRQING
jgi:glycosyltransferase involved in cell wall biosynthesis